MPSSTKLLLMFVGLFFQSSLFLKRGSQKRVSSRVSSSEGSEDASASGFSVQGVSSLSRRKATQMAGFGLESILSLGTGPRMFAHISIYIGWCFKKLLLLLTKQKALVPP